MTKTALEYIKRHANYLRKQSNIFRKQATNASLSSTKRHDLTCRAIHAQRTAEMLEAHIEQHKAFLKQPGAS